LLEESGSGDAQVEWWREATRERARVESSYRRSSARFGHDHALVRDLRQRLQELRVLETHRPSPAELSAMSMRKDTASS
jgi:hypothetical protein